MLQSTRRCSISFDGWIEIWTDLSTREAQAESVLRTVGQELHRGIGMIHDIRTDRDVAVGGVGPIPRSQSIINRAFYGRVREGAGQEPRRGIGTVHDARRRNGGNVGLRRYRRRQPPQQKDKQEKDVS